MPKSQSKFTFHFVTSASHHKAEHRGGTLSRQQARMCELMTSTGKHRNKQKQYLITWNEILNIFTSRISARKTVCL